MMKKAGPDGSGRKNFKKWTQAYPKINDVFLHPTIKKMDLNARVLGT